MLKQQAEDVKFVKKVPDHPRERRKRKLDITHVYSKRFKRNKLSLNDRQKRIAIENSKKIKKNLYKFDLNIMLNKP